MTDGRGRKVRLNVARPAALISPDFSWLARSTENGTTLSYLRRSNKVHGTFVGPSIHPGGRKRALLFRDPY